MNLIGKTLGEYRIVRDFRFEPGLGSPGRAGWVVTSEFDREANR